VETESENKQLALHHLVTEIYYILCVHFLGCLSCNVTDSQIRWFFEHDFARIIRGRGLLIYPTVNNNVDLFLQKNCDSLPN